MFYKTFGLKGFEDTKGKDIAKEYGVSEGLVSQKIKKMTSFIRRDSSMCEMLQNLM
jgi:DNA-directed RNA polymerase specialized sigma subunit